MSGVSERRIKFRSYCLGCRYGTRWALPIGQRRPGGRAAAPIRAYCVWSKHRFEWEYIVEQNGARIFTRGNFATRQRAEASAQRTWFKLAVVLGEVAA